MNVIHMIEWSGGDMPVPEGTPVLVKYRGGDLCCARAGEPFKGAGPAFWAHEACSVDIVAYAVVDVIIHPPGTDVGATGVGKLSQQVDQALREMLLGHVSIEADELTRLRVENERLKSVRANDIEKFWRETAAKVMAALMGNSAVIKKDREGNIAIPASVFAAATECANVLAFEIDCPFGADKEP